MLITFKERNDKQESIFREQETIKSAIENVKRDQVELLEIF